LSDVHVSETESDLTKIKGIYPKRALDLEIVGVKTISDLAKRSPKHLAEKPEYPLNKSQNGLWK
jgi:predicted flap endonuclease-1-like 5' DNA nuclease